MSDVYRKRLVPRSADIRFDGRWHKLELEVVGDGRRTYLRLEARGVNGGYVGAVSGPQSLRALAGGLMTALRRSAK